MAKSTVGEHAARWQAAQVVRPSTAANVSVVLRRHVPADPGRPCHGERSPIRRASSHQDPQAHARPGTVGQVVKVLRRLFAAAVDDRLITSSPCAKLRTPRDPRPPMVVPTVEQVAALAGAVPERYRALVILLAGSGLRIDEALGLIRVSDVDFCAGRFGWSGSASLTGRWRRPRRHRACARCRLAKWSSTSWPRTSPARRSKSTDPLFVTELGSR